MDRETGIGFEYLRRSVKMEFGSLTDQRPAGKHPIRPWVAEEFPDLLADFNCELVALELERTFWEKATILHAEYHRDAARPIRDHFSRHYSDTAAMATGAEIDPVLANNELRQQVGLEESILSFKLGALRLGEAGNVSPCTTGVSNR